jgi:hypothetical protein
VDIARKLFAPSFVFFLLFWAATAVPAQKLKDADCLTCHGDATLTTEGANGSTVSLFVDQNKFKHSVHGRMFHCVDCHTDVKSLAHEKPPEKVICGQCHADAQAAYAHSMHAKAGKAGGGPAANCEDCHGGAHEIVGPGGPASPVYHANIPATCGRCHGQQFLMESNGESAQAFVSYQASVHGRAIANGSKNAAVCTDCHGAHEILPANDAKSPISKFAVAATCGKCHADVANTFNVSIHGQALARGNAMSPTCTDCHGIHSIKRHTDPNSPVAEQNVSRDICARCHEGVRLSQEFGVPGNRVSSYFDSYHGLAAEGGSVVAANCSSCHGVHDILPSSDPRSTINRANLDATCGKCHKGVTQKFTRTPVHLQDGMRAGDIDSIAVRWVRGIYIALILLVIGAMFLHNAVIWRHKAVARRRMQNPYMTRMTVNQRWQHLALLTSFIILVITGFALKFPNSWFAHTLGMGEHLRGIIHRIAGVVLIGAAAARSGSAAEGCAGSMGNHAVLPGPEQRKAEVWPLQLRGEGGILGAGLGNGADGADRHHDLGQGLGGRSAGALVGGCGDRCALLRGDPGDTGDSRVALLPGVFRSRCVSHELGLVGREDAGGAL